MSGFADTTIRLAEAKREAEYLASLVGAWFLRNGVQDFPVSTAVSMLENKLELRSERAQKRAKQ